MQKDFKDIALELLTDRSQPVADVGIARTVAEALSNETQKRHRDSKFMSDVVGLFINNNLFDEEKKIIASAFPLYMVEQGIAQYCFVDNDMLTMQPESRSALIETVANGIKDIVRNKNTPAKPYQGQIISIAEDDDNFFQKMTLKLPVYDNTDKPLRSNPQVVGFVLNS